MIGGPTLPSTHPGQKGGFWPGAAAWGFVCRLGGVSKQPLSQALFFLLSPLGTAMCTSSGRNRTSRPRFQSGNVRLAPVAKAQSKEKGVLSSGFRLLSSPPLSMPEDRACHPPSFFHASSPLRHSSSAVSHSTRCNIFCDKRTRSLPPFIFTQSSAWGQ